MPERVSIEIIEGNDFATEKLYDYEETWIIRVLPSMVEEVLVWNLGDGETDVLSFAYGNRENVTALVDDRAARKCAATLNIKTLGTGGILLLAKKRGLIDSVGESLERLKKAGLYISDEIIELLKKQAGELE